MADSCALPCALCGRALAETRSRECVGPQKAGGGRAGGKRKRGASIDDKDDEDDAPVVEKLPTEGDAEAVHPKKKKRVKPPTEDDPDHALAQELSDRKLLNLSVKVLSLAIGDRKVADKWAKTVLTQMGCNLHALCNAKRKDLLKLKCKGNKAIPSKLVDRLLHVFGPARPAKSKLSSKPTTAAPKPTAAPTSAPTTASAKKITKPTPPFKSSRVILRLPK